MSDFRINRRQFTAGAAAGLAATTIGSQRAAAQAYGSNELIEAAKKEGKFVYYTADFTEPEQEVIKAFNKRFPFVKVEMVRAPGGQLITRIKTEAAAGKLLADAVNHSDRGLMQGIADLFQDYAPPNAKDYRDDVLVSPKLWPRATLGWAIAYNTELEKNPPKTWMDLCKPEYGPKKIGHVIGPSGGTTWTRIMFERQTFGEDYWKKQAATQPILYPSGAPASDSLVRGECSIARAALQHLLHQEARRRSGRHRVPVGRRPAQLLCGGRHQDGGQSECRKAVPQLVHVRGRAGDADQGARLSHGTEEPAAQSARLRPEGDQDRGRRTSISTSSCAIAGSTSGTRLTATDSDVRVPGAALHEMMRR